jgi:hypothetical protein
VGFEVTFAQLEGMSLDEKVLSETRPQSAVEYEVAVDECLAQMDRIRQQISRDEVEITRLKTETRALLAKLSHISYPEPPLQNSTQHLENVAYHVRAADALGFHAAILLTGHYGPNWEVPRRS